MESIDSLKDELKKVSQELSSHKIELHQTRGYLQSILQNSRDMIFATEVSGLLISFSKGGEKVLGYTWGSVAGNFIKDFANDPLEFERLMAATQKEGSAVRLELPFRNKDGHTVYCDVSLISLTNTKGQNIGTIGICRDITRWKKLQEDLIRVDRLAEIGRIASGIAHEINNPLAVISEISGWAGAVVSDAKGLTHEDREELETAVKHIKEQTRRCKGITHQLLGFVRDSTPDKTKIDVHELLKEVIKFLKPELRYLPIEIVFNFSKEPLSTKSDPNMMEQVFLNLITNAIYAIREEGRNDGKVEIRTKKTDSGVEVNIEDNGTGISEENQAKILDLFFTTKPPGKGTGLGLPICQNILKNLGGSLSFKSESGVGSTFTVQIPFL